MRCVSCSGIRAGTRAPQLLQSGARAPIMMLRKKLLPMALFSLGWAGMQGK